MGDCEKTVAIVASLPPCTDINVSKDVSNDSFNKDNSREGTDMEKATNDAFGKGKSLKICPVDVENANYGRVPSTKFEGSLGAFSKHQSESGSDRVESAFRKPATWAVGLLLLVCIGGLLYLSIQRFHNRTLIEKLQTEINQLSGENPFGVSVQELQDEIQALNQQNQLLNSSNAVYENINLQLNETVKKLEFQNQILARQNEIYEGLNTDLNGTTEHLLDEVDRLEQVVDNLNGENDDLASLSNSLRGEIRTLRDLSDDLKNSVTSLETQVRVLFNETDRLQNMNKNLENIVAFLNETDFDGTYEELANLLSEQITAFQSAVLEMLQNTYAQRIANWDCAYRDRFGLEEFAHDDRLPIGDEFYLDVINYVDERVLSELCLSRSDFELYLDDRFVREGKQPPVSATTNHFIRGIQLYTMAAMNYYFPGVGIEDGLTVADWARASFDCHKFPAESQFFMM